jgi:hypothetical protein
MPLAQGMVLSRRQQHFLGSSIASFAVAEAVFWVIGCQCPGCRGSILVPKSSAHKVGDALEPAQTTESLQISMENDEGREYMTTGT